MSVRRFGNDQGLAILRFSPAPHLAQDGDNGDWFTDLVALLHPALPQLCIDQDGDTNGPGAMTLSPQPEVPSVPAPASARPERAAARELENTALLLPQAAAALERSRFKEAERLGRLAQAAGEAESAEFLQALGAIRRGSKLVRRWPRDPQARLELAQAYFVADAGKAAIREAMEALRLDPSLGEAHALVGLEHLYQDQRELALAAWERARTLASGGEWQQSLGQALEDQARSSATSVARRAPRVERGWRAVVGNLLPALDRVWHRAGSK